MTAPFARRFWGLLAACVALTGFAPPAALAAEGESARLDVAGLGWWRNRELRLSLDRLLGEERGATMNANAVEDAVFLLVAALEEEGYLRPSVTAVLTHADGRESRHEFDARLETLLPRPMAVSRARFEVGRGVRFVFRNIRFAGLQAVPEEEARGFFGEEAGLWLGKGQRAYSPERLRRAIDALQGALAQLGYAEAAVAAENVSIDETGGHVDVDVVAMEGPLWRVRSLEVLEAAASGAGVGAPAGRIGEPWTYLWQQDVAAEVRRAYQSQGYPDVRVRVEAVEQAAKGGERAVDAVVRVEPGTQVRLGDVRFAGGGGTREPVLRRRVTAQAGELLDPVALDRMRHRLGSLGIFDTVELRYEPAAGAVRDAIFVLDEAPRWEASLLAGYGSYEQLRGGVELRQVNLLGRAHLSRLQLVQSLKSSRGEYSYTVPELFGERVDGTARIFGFQREEQAFVRQEYGGSVILRRPAPFIRADASAGYTYQALRTKDNELETREIDETQVTVASVDLGLNRDTRDNPLRPRQGYRWFVQVEAAGKVLGGEVDYQRTEFGLSWHRPVGRGRWLHAGLTHGVLTTAGAASDRDLPVNKRFFPGGDSSIRGYQAGEAAPLAPDGRFIGAKTVTLLNLEFEQTVVGNWTAVLFLDALGSASRLADYPWDERLAALGLGVRYQTLIGPVRLEYGRNLNKREGDPGGTLHFSVGFPF